MCKHEQWAFQFAINVCSATADDSRWHKLHYTTRVVYSRLCRTRCTNMMRWWWQALDRGHQANGVMCVCTARTRGVVTCWHRRQLRRHQREFASVASHARAHSRAVHKAGNYVHNCVCKWLRHTCAGVKEILGKQIYRNNFKIEY